LQLRKFDGIMQVVTHLGEKKMTDPTESIRRELVNEINREPSERQRLEAKHGQVWSTQELQDDFDVVGFMAPFVVVRRKSDGAKGSLTFQHGPRFYFSFQKD
jgi:hypothetical protein